MSSLPTCVQCGGKEFFIESGFYFCAECQIQSQDIREELMSEFVSGTQTKITVVKEPASQTTTSDQKISTQRELTSWEVLNYVLKGWIDELIKLGVDHKVKVIALQLWVAYLRKLEVAFTSTVVCKKPRLGFTFRSRDAELIYGVTKTESKALKKAFSRSSASSSKVSDCDATSTSFSRIRSRKRKALAEALYEAESGPSDTSRSNISLQNLSVLSPASSKSSKMCYTADAKKTLTKLFDKNENESDMEEKGFKYKSICVTEKKSLRHLNVHTVFALLRLALLIARSPVQLSDMFRWSREGYFSLNNCEKLLPASVTARKDIKFLLVTPINSWVLATKKVWRLANYLSVKNVGVDLFGICCKLVKDLHLPDDILNVIRKLLYLCPPQLTLSMSVNYEGRAAALIIFVLKLCYSLDGSTELHNSTAAKAINKWLDITGRDDKKLFVWTDWTEALEFHDAVISKYHIPTRDLWYSGCNIHASIDSFIGQWSMAPKQQTLQRLKEVDRCVASSLDYILDPLSCEGREPLKPCQSLLEQVDPLIEPSVRSRLTSLLDSAKNSSISIYFHNKRLRELALESECRFEMGIEADLRCIEKYMSANIKHRSKHFQRIVTVDLFGDQLSTSSGSEADTENWSEWDDDTDDSTVQPPPKKRKTFSKLNLSGDRCLEVKNGNIASRINLENEFLNGTSIEPVMYVPDFGLWRLEGSFYRDSLSVEEFEELARSWFSLNFLWLLKRCSALVDQSIKDIYYQLLLVETVYFRFVSRKRDLITSLKKKW